MDPQHTDALFDLIYGILLLVSFVLVLQIKTSTGVAFGLGIIVSYVVHVAWKMARFDPDWMSRRPEDFEVESTEPDQ